jgi:hypothetical protein
VQVIARAEQDTGPAADYPRFHAAVALAQLTGWLPGDNGFLIDISGPDAHTAEVAAAAGHSVLRVIDAGTPVPPAPPPADGARLSTVTADGTGLSFLPDGCADGVIAEARTFSLRLAAENLVTEVTRVLKPGGQLLACVDSLTFGMAMLAEQHRWPYLVDVPNADVVLIPWPDGSITRCYGAEQLRELFTGGGLEVSWIRPRTVLPPQTVSYLLARDPARFDELVSAELRARSDDSVGSQLIACCVKKPLPATAFGGRAWTGRARSGRWPGGPRGAVPAPGPSSRRTDRSCRPRPGRARRAPRSAGPLPPAWTRRSCRPRSDSRQHRLPPPHRHGQGGVHPPVSKPSCPGRRAFPLGAYGQR